MNIYLKLNLAAILEIQGQLDQAQTFLEHAWTMAQESGSAYEQNLCRLENGRFNIHRKPAVAMQELQLATEFFESQGHTLESLRARLYLLLARWNSLSHSEELRQDISDFISPLINRDTPSVILGLVRESRPLLAPLTNDEKLAELVKELLVRLERFDAQLNVLRRRMRRQATTIPFVGPQLVIQTLGKIQIKLNNHILTIGDWQTQSARDLFLYLLTRPDGVSREAVGAVFWRDCSPHELHLRFKNTLYRLRRAVGRDVVLFQDGIYRFNTDLDYEYDVEQFFREIYHAERSSDSRQKILHYQTLYVTTKGLIYPA